MGVVDNNSLFSNSNSVELAIVAVCTFAATVAVVGTPVFVHWLFYFQERQTDNNLHEMKSY